MSKKYRKNQLKILIRFYALPLGKTLILHKKNEAEQCKMNNKEKEKK